MDETGSKLKPAGQIFFRYGFGTGRAGSGMGPVQYGVSQNGVVEGKSQTLNIFSRFFSATRSLLCNASLSLCHSTAGSLILTSSSTGNGLRIAHFGLLILCSRSLLCSRFDLFSTDCLFSGKSQTFMIYFLILDLNSVLLFYG